MVDRIIQGFAWVMDHKWWTITPLIFVLLYLASGGKRSLLFYAIGAAFIFVIKNWSTQFFEWYFGKYRDTNRRPGVKFHMVAYLLSIPSGFLFFLLGIFFDDSEHIASHVVLAFTGGLLFVVVFFGTFYSFSNHYDKEWMNIPTADLKKTAFISVIFLAVVIVLLGARAVTKVI